MSLLRWMGVSPTSTPSNPHQTGSQGANSSGKDALAGTAVTKPPVNSADAKRFGLENFGNTCYANSVLQALYFCEPFRELVTLQPDNSSLYPPPPPLPLPALPVPSNPSSSSTGQATKSSQPTTSKPTTGASSQSSKSGGIHPQSKKPIDPRATGGYHHKRPVSGSHEAKDEERDNGPNTGPGIGNNPPSLFVALRSLFVHIAGHTHEKGTVAPQAFIAKLKRDNELFRSTMHQDAHEFLNYLINRVVEDLEEEEKLGREERKRLREQEREKLKLLTTTANGSANPVEDLSVSIMTTSTSKDESASTSKRGKWVHELFEGTLTSETRCLTCETVSSRSEMFLDLSIDIEQNSSITACLRQFSASEMLCQRNKFFCDSCCGLQEAEKRMKIKRVPEVLVVHLKRFKYQEEEGKYVKLSYRVAWPFELRLFNTVDDAGTDGRPLDRLYELWAVVIHIGGGPLHGHYVTLIKSQGTWYLFDDNTVETIREADIPKYYGDSGSGTGYVLFYQAVDLDREKLGLRPHATAAAAAAAPTTTTTAANNIVPDALVQNGLHVSANGVPHGAPLTAEVQTQTQLLAEPADSTKLSYAGASGPPSPAIPISIEPSSPPPPLSSSAAVPVPGTGTGTEVVDPSVPPSPSVPLIHATTTTANKLEIPSRGHSPIGSPASLTSPPPISASTSTSTSGGFFGALGSLRHSKSVKADRTSLGLGHAAKIVSNGDVGNSGHGPEEKEKEKSGWLSFRNKEKRRESVSQTQSQTQSHAGSQSVLQLQSPSNAPSVPASPLYPTTPATNPPPSPLASTTPGRKASIGMTMDTLSPLPAAALPPLQITSAMNHGSIPPVPPLIPGSPLLSHPVTNTQGQSSTRRASTADGPTVDGSDSFSGSSSWTSGVGIPGLEIPPVPKELPPLPPLPVPIPIPTPSHSHGTPAGDTLVLTPLNVGSNGQGTITQSPVPSTWSMPTSAGGEGRPDGDKLPVGITTAMSSIAGSSSAGVSDLSIVTQSQQQPPLPVPPTPSSATTNSHQTPPSASAASSSAAIQQPRLAKMSIKDIKEAAKARKAADALTRKAEEERKRAEKHERERLEEEKKKAEKEQHKLAKRTSRKLSLGLGGIVGWGHKDKEKDRGASSFPGNSSSSSRTAATVGANGTSS